MTDVNETSRLFRLVIGRWKPGFYCNEPGEIVWQEVHGLDLVDRRQLESLVPGLMVVAGIVAVRIDCIEETKTGKRIVNREDPLP